MNERLANLTGLDMSTVSLVIMGWGTNDYTAGISKQTILDSYNSVIDTLQSTYPELRILITTPIWRYFDGTINGDNKVYNDATLKEIAEAIESFAKEKRISVLNAYQNMPLNYNTVSAYFDEGDGVHLNAKGNMVYAHLLNGKIRSMY
jgi:lysophospholipase L1-like esterase